jgi:hypoxanthine phosphoribosyltransferase
MAKELQLAEFPSIEDGPDQIICSRVTCSHQKIKQKMFPHKRVFKDIQAKELLKKKCLLIDDIVNTFSESLKTSINIKPQIFNPEIVLHYNVSHLSIDFGHLTIKGFHIKHQLPYLNPK